MYFFKICICDLQFVVCLDEHNMFKNYLPKNPSHLVPPPPRLLPHPLLRTRSESQKSQHCWYCCHPHCCCWCWPRQGPPAFCWWWGQQGGWCQLWVTAKSRWTQNLCLNKDIISKSKNNKNSKNIIIADCFLKIIKNYQELSKTVLKDHRQREICIF